MKKIQNQAWPNDVDGDVFRRMKSSGFDFDATVDIDFNIDFDDWPPSAELIELLREKFAVVRVYESDDLGSGYIQLVLNERVTYEVNRHHSPRHSAAVKNAAFQTRLATAFH
ncbi:hypothetical protein GTP45_09575 [Pseudoduganella sp. FT55W]|uniref:Regulator of ribonuclease activity B domain-containing protein n=1 Tax=Duganella rivi TaxID=2666083 RepID=A0A7X4GP38_9BURK|nr:hypothetical protein [Duganella rivi]